MKRLIEQTPMPCPTPCPMVEECGVGRTPLQAGGSVRGGVEPTSQAGHRRPEPPGIPLGRDPLIAPRCNACTAIAPSTLIIPPNLPVDKARCHSQ